MAFVLSVAVIAIAVAAVHVSEWWFSPGVMILPILAGGLLMWPRALRIFFVFVTAGLIYNLVKGRAGAGIVATIVLTAVFAEVLARTRKKLGVQGLRGDRMLLELRDRIQAQGKLPSLGEGWGLSVVFAAGGSSFGGDFVVSFCDGKMLEVALVDVSGKGIDAGTRALLLSGASADCSAPCRGRNSCPPATPTCAAARPRKASSPQCTCRSTWPPEVRDHLAGHPPTVH